MEEESWTIREIGYNEKKWADGKILHTSYYSFLEVIYLHCLERGIKPMLTPNDS